VNVTTQVARAARLMSLDPFHPAAESTRPAHKVATREHGPGGRATEVGCVDWYLYPVNREPRRTER